MSPSNPTMEFVPVDFGRTAGDYARYRTAFPPELFTRLAAIGIGKPCHRVVDLGAGTGALARGFANAGCTVTGVDIAAEMLAEAGRHNGPTVTYREAPAEDTGLPGGAWDVVAAGQSWHWFDRPKVLAEVRRLLVPGGALAICYRDYRVVPGNVCAISEELVLAYHPTWPMAKTGYHDQEWRAEIEAAGFDGCQGFSFDVDVAFTHEEWRGRMRSSNGVGASLTDERVAAFDAELAALLRTRFPEEPLMIPHRIWTLTAHINVTTRAHAGGVFGT